MIEKEMAEEDRKTQRILKNDRKRDGRGGQENPKKFENDRKRDGRGGYVFASKGAGREERRS